MSHPQQRAWCESVKAKFPDAFIGKRVLDVGSRNINGDNRYLFTDCRYTGLDVTPGPNVDVVTKAHLHMGEYDTIISTECLEHDAFWCATLNAMRRMLKPGGLLVTTCATTGRPEHGTARSKPEDAPGLPWDDYYKNLTEADFRWAFEPDMLGWSEYAFSIGHDTCDLYFWSIRRPVPK